MIMTILRGEKKKSQYKEGNYKFGFKLSLSVKRHWKNFESSKKV